MAGIPSQEAFSPEYFKDNFNTPLTPEEEVAYKNWLGIVGREDNTKDYDLRGAFKESAAADNRGHLTDRYKKPNHPTFSDESIYNNTLSPLGVPFQGGQWKKEGQGWTYQPSDFMMQYTEPQDDLIQYMKKYEPKARLKLK